MSIISFDSFSTDIEMCACAEQKKKQQQQMNAMSFFKINKDRKNRRPN
jgi:hypothetical protein